MVRRQTITERVFSSSKTEIMVWSHDDANQHQHQHRCHVKGTQMSSSERLQAVIDWSPNVVHCLLDSLLYPSLPFPYNRFHRYILHIILVDHTGSSTFIDLQHHLFLRWKTFFFSIRFVAQFYLLFSFFFSCILRIYLHFAKRNFSRISGLFGWNGFCLSFSRGHILK